MIALSSPLEAEVVVDEASAAAVPAPVGVVPAAGYASAVAIVAHAVAVAVLALHVAVAVVAVFLVAVREIGRAHV